jgi:asparagine synthase (glutamine-hydrolysing)
MCGIAGILDFTHAPSLDALHRMVEIQHHRGPDAHGEMVEGPIALGMRRLAIIDLATGNQPLSNEDGAITVVFNGEIFNYVELRQELLRHGHVFGTCSDTEVLLHGYEQWGVDLLPRLNGMFAFALWDRRRQRLLLARDRMGVKPLYYAWMGSRLAFASELKALRTQPELDRTLDLDAIADYLRLGYIPREASPLRAVRRLLPGYLMLVDPSGSTVRRWWSIEECLPAELDDAAARDRDSLIAAFDDAVRLRMRSDVPVAAFLSGGLDSSLVSATATRFSERALNTYTVAFTDTRFDETPYARAVAERYGTVHHERTVSPGDAIQMLPRLLWYMDEPLADSALLPNYLVSRFAAERVKVCLSGLGGDELFGGYLRYADRGPGRVRRLFGRTPRLAGALVGVADRYHPGWAAELRLAAGEEHTWQHYLQDLQIFDPRAIQRLGLPTTGRTDAVVEDLWNRYPHEDWVGRRQFVDQHLYLPDQILALTDRMSMAVSLEVRVPFMDPRLVRFAAALPGSRKQTRTEFKIYLKEALGDRVPEVILHRPKWGFASPVERWLVRPELFRIVQRLPERLRELLDPRVVRSWVRDPVTASRHAGHVWTLLTLDVWCRVHEASEPPDIPLTELV